MEDQADHCDQVLASTSQGTVRYRMLLWKKFKISVMCFLPSIFISILNGMINYLRQEWPYERQLTLSRTCVAEINVSRKVEHLAEDDFIAMI